MKLTKQAREELRSKLESQIEKVKIVREIAHMPMKQIDLRRSFIGLCDVILELLVMEKDRQKSED